MEREVASIGLFFAEDLEGGVFRGRSEGEEAEVFVLTVGFEFFVESVFSVGSLVFFGVFNSGEFFEDVFGFCQGFFEFFGGFAGLR